MKNQDCNVQQIKMHGKFITDIALDMYKAGYLEKDVFAQFKASLGLHKEFFYAVNYKKNKPIKKAKKSKSPRK